MRLLATRICHYALTMQGNPLMLLCSCKASLVRPKSHVAVPMLPGSVKALLLPGLLDRASTIGTKRTQRVRAMCDKEIFVYFLSGPDGSRHSSDQYPKDVNSEHLNYCPIFVPELLSSRRLNPEVWISCV